MHYIALWLEAPLQAWGVESKFNRRDTLPFPSKSGLLGIILSAMGATGPQNELLARLTKGSLTVVRFGKEKVVAPQLIDFHMVGSGYNDNDAWENYMIPKTAEGKKPNGSGTKLTYRHYLQDAYFGVVFSVNEDELAIKVSEYLQNPVFDVFLGRRCCVPTDIIWRGMYSTYHDAEVKILQIADAKGLKELFKVQEGNNPEIGMVRMLNDVPIQFGEQKMYCDRFVTIITPENQNA